MTISTAQRRKALYRRHLLYPQHRLYVHFELEKGKKNKHNAFCLNKKKEIFKTSWVWAEQIEMELCQPYCNLLNNRKANQEWFRI